MKYIAFSDLESGATVVVVTNNSTYRLRILDGRSGLALVSGGAYVVPRKAHVSSEGRGGARMCGISERASLRILVDHSSDVRTSAVRSISVVSSRPSKFANDAVRTAA